MTIARRDDEWPFYVRGYYGPEVKSPKVQGALAFETKHKTETSRDVTVDAAHSRNDIGRVEWGFRNRSL